MGSALSSPVTAQHLQRRCSSHIQAGLAELQGWREEHEDSHILDCSWGGNDSQKGLFAVFDGHGGSSAADFSAAYFPLKMAAKKHVSDEDIVSCFLSCDEAYKSTPDCVAGAAACLVLTEKLPNGKYNVRFANAGDCRAVVVSTKISLPDSKVRLSLEDDTLRQMSPLRSDSDGSDFADENDCGVILTTVDHKPNHPNERKRIIAAGGTVTREAGATYRLGGNLALSRMIGDFAYKQNPSLSPHEQMASAVPEIFSIEADEGDLIVLACDGIFDVLSNNEIARQVRLRVANAEAETGRPADLAKIASDIITLSLDKLESKDNMTLIIIKLQGLNGDSTIPSKEEDELVTGDYLRSKSDENGGRDNYSFSVKQAFEEFFAKCGYAKSPNACVVCKRIFKAMSQCPCKQAVYCDNHCQKSDWKNHRKLCTVGKQANGSSQGSNGGSPLSDNNLKKSAQ